MFIRPLILRSPDGDGGGGGAPAVIAAPPATAPAPGPKPFTPSAADARPNGTIRESLNKHGNPDPNAPPAKNGAPSGKEAPKPTEPPKPSEAKVEPPKPGEASTKADPPVIDAAKAKSKETWNSLKSKAASAVTRAEAAEARIKEFESAKLKDDERARFESTTKRNEELENEIRFANWKKSKDYEKHYAPYAEKWGETVAFLGKIPIIDAASGEPRAGTQDDLIELFSLDPVAMDKRATEMVGGSPTLAARLIGQVEKAQELSASLAKAEQEALANGKARETENQTKTKGQLEKLSKLVEEVNKATDEEWSKDPDAATFGEIKPREDGKELTPDEVAHNESVAKGRKMAQIFDKSLRDCKTPEEARKLLRDRRIAINRSIHFGPLRKLYHKVLKENATLKANQKAIDATTPDTGGRRTNGASTAAPEFRSSIRKSLTSHAFRR
jgi:hypothetical protein